MIRFANIRKARRRVLPVVVLLTLAATNTSPSALAADADSQLWTQFTFSTRLKQRLRLFAEVQPRLGNGYDNLSLLIVRTAVGYQVTPNFSVWLGHGWTPAFFPEFNSEDRWFQQFLLEDRYPGFQMINRTRLEQRAIAGAGAASVRLRHMLRLARPLDAADRWAAVFSNELFWNLNSTPGGPEAGFDQNRAYIGFAYNATQSTRIELGYMANFLNPPRGGEDRRLDILLLSVNFNL